MRSLTMRTTLVLLACFLRLEIVKADNRLSKPEKLKVVYDPENESILISWSEVTNAKKYTLRLKDEDSQDLIDKSVKKPGASFDANILTDGTQYTAEIKALKNGSYKASKATKKKFKFNTKVPTEEKTAEFKATNSGGRKGVYFLPKNYRLKTLPLMIVFHGSGISGINVLKLFRKLASEEGFIIIAPDSSDPMGWYVPDSESDVTEDVTHFYSLLEEMKSLPNLNIDPEYTLISGVSAGGFMASFFGTNDSQFKFAANLHGGIVFSSIGTNKIPFYLATGNNDEIRPPSFMIEYRKELLERGFPSVTYEEFNAAHQVLEDEQKALINWWLKR